MVAAVHDAEPGGAAGGAGGDRRRHWDGASPDHEGQAAHALHWGDPDGMPATRQHRSLQRSQMCNPGHPGNCRKLISIVDHKHAHVVIGLIDFNGGP